MRVETTWEQRAKDLDKLNKRQANQILDFRARFQAQATSLSELRLRVTSLELELGAAQARLDELENRSLAQKIKAWLRP